MNIEKEDGLYTDFGQKLRGPVMDYKGLMTRMEAFGSSKTVNDARQWMARVQRLCNPIFMTVLEQAMTGQPLPDEARIFNFMGSGGSDFTFVAEWRALFGDERESLKQMEKDFQEEYGDYHNKSETAADVGDGDKIGPKAD